MEESSELQPVMGLSLKVKLGIADRLEDHDGRNLGQLGQSVRLITWVLVQLKVQGKKKYNMLVWL